MRRGYRRTATFEVPLEIAPAMELFTPEGERAWAGHGWDPHYPDPTRRLGAGAVFLTAHDGREGTWVMVDHEPDRVRYARVGSDGFAGTIEVRAQALDESATSVAVTYDMTALTDDAGGRVEELEAAYDAEIARWDTEIRRALAAGHHG